MDIFCIVGSIVDVPIVISSLNGVTQSYKFSCVVTPKMLIDDGSLKRSRSNGEGRVCCSVGMTCWWMKILSWI